MEEKNSGESPDLKTGDVANEQIPNYYQQQELKISVLFVANDGFNTRLARRILFHIPNVHFKSAAFAEEGLVIAIRENPDLIIVDLQLPDMTGYQMLAELKAHPMTRKIPLFAMGMPRPPGKNDRPKDRDIKRFLSKPIKVNEFFDAVNAEISDIYRSKQSTL